MKKNVALSITKTFITSIWLLLVPAATVSAQQSLSAKESVLPKFEALHLWATDAEQAALKVIRDAVLARGVHWEEQFVSTNFPGVRDTFSKRLAIGIPPASVFWIGGKELEKLVEEGTLRKVPDEIGTKKFSEILIPELSEIIAMEEGITSVPLGIHLQNNVVYNMDHLNAVARDIPKSWNEFLETAELLRKAGYTALSQSSQAWQIRSLIVSILAEQFEPDDFRDFFDAMHKRQDARKVFERTFEILDSLKRYSNSDHLDLPWINAVENVEEGKATANFLGDYSSPVVRGEDNIVCAAPPGNKIVIWSFDTAAFVNTNDPAIVEGQDIFAEEVSRTDVHQQYIEAKGGLPVLQNVDSRNFDSCTKFNLGRWKNAVARYHFSGGTWLQQFNIITSSAKLFWEDTSGSYDKQKAVDSIMESFALVAGK